MRGEADEGDRALLETVRRVHRGLREAGGTVAVAESCTAGLLGAALTSVPGSSDVFWGGVIAYADDAKRRMLGVEAETLVEHGAVSEPVALAMARGLRERSGADWTVAVTGIAGPGGGTPEKPVGTVWVAASGPRDDSIRLDLSGDRARIRRDTVRRTLERLAELVGEQPKG
ncbi:MAG: CinA family protein [Gemmatimonadota bacterium]